MRHLKYPILSSRRPGSFVLIVRFPLAQTCSPVATYSFTAKLRLWLTLSKRASLIVYRDYELQNQDHDRPAPVAFALTTNVWMVSMSANVCCQRLHTEIVEGRQGFVSEQPSPISSGLLTLLDVLKSTLVLPGCGIAIELWSTRIICLRCQISLALTCLFIAAYSLPAKCCSGLCSRNVHH